MHTPHKGDYQYHYVTGLQQRVHNLEQRLKAAEDSSGMTALREKYAAERAGLERRIQSLENKVTAVQAQKDREISSCTRHWFGVMEDVERYANTKIAEAEERESHAWDQAVSAEAALAEARAEIAELERAAAERDEQIEDLKGQLARRNRALRMNHNNSSIPSSGEGVKKRKIHNGRGKTGRKPGGQPGHKGHGRPVLEPTEEPVFVPGPEEYAQNEEWEYVGVRRKLYADLDIRAKVTPYDFAVYRNRYTGKEVHAAIPPELHNEINYGEKLKAAIVLAHTEFNMPARSVREFLKEVSGGSVTVSHGFIAGLTSEFAVKSEQERAQIAKSLLAGAFMHIDTTVAQCSRKRHHVTVNVNDEAALLSYSHHKGKEAAEKTPYGAGYDGCGVHDGEATFDNYTDRHQQCHAHLLRHLQDVEENEPDRKWAPGMKKLLQQIAHDRKSWPEDGPDAVWKKTIRAKYTRLVNIGRTEYEQTPASKYYRNGENLLKRFIEQRESILYFLDHPEVPTTNNLAERTLRPVKRKEAAGMCWRSPESLDSYCQTKSVLTTERMNGRSCFEKAVEVMKRPKPAPESAS